MRLPLLLDMVADTFGDRVVVGAREGGLTAAELRERVDTAAAELVASGSDAVVYLAQNGPALTVALLAAARAGLSLVPINYRLGKEQLDGLLAHHPRAFGVAEGAEATAALDRAGIGHRTPAEWLAQLAARPAPAPEPVDEDAPAVVIYTSGTTSAPKGVLLRHANLVSYVLGTVEFGSAVESDAALVSVPPYHIAAVANVLTNLYAGRRTFVLQQFAPAEWLDLVEREQITNALVVPTMLARILDEVTDEQLPALRTLAYGGASMPSRVIERALRMWPHVDFVNAYGLTETSSTVAVLGPDDHRAALGSDDPQVRARLGSAGRAVPGVDIEIRDATGDAVGSGIPGRIFIRGAQVSAEYAGQGPVLDEQGFFDTRDEGYLDADGYLFVGGRADDTIIRGGENIAPAEIEDVLLQHPAVVDVVVVGVPDEEWGQRIEAAAVLRPGDAIDAEGLRGYARERLRGSKTPDRIVFWDEIPRTETGKLVRREALTRLTSGH